MKIREVMTSPPIRIHPQEPASVAARLLERYNVGALPVCGADGKLCGLLTDRDLVTRCMASGRAAEQTTVAELMSRGVVTVGPDQDASAAAQIMASRQIRRLPVVESGKVCGMVSLGDLADKDLTDMDAADTLARICTNVSDPEGQM